MADNYVRLSIRADDTAKPDLTDLRARLEELKNEVATARANVDDADADAKLTDLDAKLEAISKKVASPKIDMAGASKALAQLTAVEAAMDHLDDKSGKDGEDAGNAFASGFGGAVNDLSSQLGGSGLGKEAEKGGEDAGGLWHNSFVTTVLGGLAGTLVTGIGSVLAAVPALGAVAGAGMVGALGAVVADKIPGVAAQFSKFGTQVMGTLEQAVKPLVPYITGALKQLGSFVQQIEPLLAGMFKTVGPMIQPLIYGLEGLVGGILPGLTSLLKSAMPAMQAFASILGGLGRDLGGLFSALAPAVAASSVALRALFSILGGLLPVVGQIAGTMAKLLAPILMTVASLFTQMGPVITGIASIFGEFAKAFLINLAGGMEAVVGLVRALTPAFHVLAGALGQVFNLMNNRGVFNDIEDALEELVGPVGKLITVLVSGLAPVIPPLVQVLGALAGILQSALVSAVTALAPVLEKAVVLVSALLMGLMPLMPAVTRIAAALLGGLLQALLGMLPAINAMLNALMPLVPVITKVATIIADVLAAGLTAVMPLLVRLAPYILAIVGAVKAWSVAQAVLDALMDANPLGAIILAIVALIGVVVEIIRHWHDLEVAAKVAFAAVTKAVSDAFDWVKSHWPLVLGILLGPIALAAAEIAQHWRQILSGAESMVHGVTSWFSDMGSDIVRIVDGLAGDLFSAGARIISFLAGGIRSAIGDVTGAISNVVNEVKSFLPFSPAKKGPLSGGGAPQNSGRSIVRQIAQGLAGGVSDVTAAMERVTGAVTAGSARGGTHGGAAAGGSQEIIIRLEGNGDMFIRALRNYIRVKGGNVQKVLGQ